MLKTWRMPMAPLILAREAMTRGVRQREPEPMVMDEPQGVTEYDEAGAALQVPVHHFNALALSRLLPAGGTLVDLGCGSGRLLARLARGRPDAHLVGLDLSEPMLETGRQLLANEGVADQVELRRGDITTFDDDLPAPSDVVSCNFTLHQLPSEELVRGCLEAIARARELTGCGVYLFDLVRLRNARTWPTLMSLLKTRRGSVFWHDALASERAAFTFAEMTELLEHAGLDELRHVRARPLGEYQVHWVARRDGTSAGAWQDVPLPQGTRLATEIVLRSFPRALT